MEFIGAAASTSPVVVTSAFQKVFLHVVYGFLASVGFFVAQWKHADHLSASLWSNFEFEHPVDVFDFIVVGSGSSGAVVANRLSENPNWRVLLLEAGGEPHPFHQVPLLSNFMLNYKEVDWGHLTVPQSYSCFGLRNRQSGWSQGRSLGGTSNLNFLIYLRGNPLDYDNWANITGDQRWNYQHLLPHFKRSESFQRPRVRQTGAGSHSPLHGFKGPMSVEIPSYHVLAKEFINAGKEMGFDHVDLNGYYTQGFDYLYYSSHRGRRDAVFNSHIQPARKRPNLSIYKYSLATRILLRESDNEAYGIEYEKLGVKKVAYATKEIILSAGAMQTPKLLMLSGIGRQEHLQSHGIPVKVNLPVGDNLQDHLSTYLGPFVMETPGSFFVDRDVTLSNVLKYIFKGTGPLTSSYCSATSLFTSTWAKFQGEAAWPDLQIILSPVGTHPAYAKDIAKSFLVKRDLLEKYYAPSVNRDSFMLSVAVGRPLSRGYIRLQGPKPKQDLIIDPRYYERDEDAKRMVEGMKFAVALVENTNAFKRFGRVKLAGNPLPGCEGFQYRSDAYWDCYMRYLSISLHHASGTASMGRVGSPDAVVDSELRVIGTKRLRVMDASVIPVIPVSNIQAVCMMIGEKGADLIKSDWITSTPPQPPPVVHHQRHPNLHGMSHHHLGHHEPINRGTKIVNAILIPQMEHLQQQQQQQPTTTTTTTMHLVLDDSNIPGNWTQPIPILPLPANLAYLVDGDHTKNAI